MGIVRTDEHRRSEIESFRRLLLSCAGACKSKEEEEIRNSPVMNADNDGVVHDKVVCVTSGVSFLGIAIVNQLLLRGYNVRIIVDNQGNFPPQLSSRVDSITGSGFRKTALKYSAFV